MRVPSAAGLRLNLREPSARRRVWDADQNLAGRTLNLPAGELRFALQRLVAVGTVKFEFIRVHKMFALHFIMRKPWVKSI